MNLKIETVEAEPGMGFVGIFYNNTLVYSETILFTNLAIFVGLFFSCFLLISGFPASLFGLFLLTPYAILFGFFVEGGRKKMVGIQP